MNYKIWATIIIIHEYFGGKCGYFKFQPDNTSKENMKRDGFLMKETSSGFNLIARESAFSEEKSLVFWATPTQQELWSATLFSDVAKESIPFAKAKNKSFQWESIDKDHLPEEMRLPSPMFGIEISHSSDSPEATIVVSLKTKKMKWRYNFSGLSEFGEVEIVGSKANKKNSQFDITVDNSGTTIFTSKEDIPLCHGFAPRFLLREKKTSKAIIKCLPNMDARSITSAVLDNGKYETIAETFINT